MVPWQIILGKIRQGAMADSQGYKGMLLKGKKGNTFVAYT